MSKHGNNNARWVLLSESQNLKYYAHNLSEYAHNKIRLDADFNILDEEGKKTVHEMIMRMEKTISELKTILPKGDGTGDSPPDNNGGDKVSTQTKAETIHRYRETDQYKKLASLLEGYSQHTIDDLYMSLAGNMPSREKLDDRLDALNLDPKIEHQVFAIFRERD